MKKQEIESGDNIRVVNEWNEVLHGQLHYWDKFNDDGCLVMKNGTDFLNFFNFY